MGDSVTKNEELEKSNETKKRSKSSTTVMKSFNKVVNDLGELGLLNQKELTDLAKLRDSAMSNFINTI